MILNTVFDENMDRYPLKNNSNLDCELKNVCLQMGLLDIWRKTNPHLKLYTWCNKELSLQSRIDFWLISSDLVKWTIDVSIEPAILTDHKGIFIKMDNKDTL